MHLYQIHAVRYSATSKLEGSVTVKDTSTQTVIQLSAEEAAEFEAVANRVFLRHQSALVAKMQLPLETNLLTAPKAPLIEDADFTEVPATGADF